MVRNIHARTKERKEKKKKKRKKASLRTTEKKIEGKRRDYEAIEAKVRITG